MATKSKSKNKSNNKKVMPKHFPFWARFKKNKNRTTLVIDEEVVTKNGKKEDVMFIANLHILKEKITKEYILIQIKVIKKQCI